MAQTTKFQGTARKVGTTPQGKYYRYHKTEVVMVLNDGSIKLDSGGYQTATTKLAMNQASNQDKLGFIVLQRQGEWFVQYCGEELPFEDGMILPRCIKDN